jgi:hypothetical protein
MIGLPALIFTRRSETELEGGPVETIVSYTFILFFEIYCCQVVVWLQFYS